MNVEASTTKRSAKASCKEAMKVLQHAIYLHKVLETRTTEIHLSRIK